MSEALVKVDELPGSVLRLTLNDEPTRNAMSTEMAAEFARAVSSVRGRSDLRVVILTGAGKAFSGGGHLDMLFEKTKLSREKNQELMELFYEQFLGLRELEIPVVAAINGHAVGAGLCLAMACDIRIASMEAKLGLNFVNIGLHPGMAATYFLPRLVGPAVAADLLYTGRIISAEEGARLGLVNKAVPDDEFAPAVAKVVQAISSAGPLAIRQTKQSLRMSHERSLAECLSREAQCQSVNYTSEEFLEGITAAKEKRKAKF